MKKLNFKKIAGLTGAAAVILVSAAAITKVELTKAQSGGVKTTKSQAMRRGAMPTAGTVSAINGNSISLAGKNGKTYSVDATGATITKISNGTKTTIGVSGIQTGDTLIVSGAVTGSNIAAKNITDGLIMAMQQPAASGTVASISGNTITLTGSNGTSYTVDASNIQISINKSGVSLQNSGVQTNDSLTVFGTVSGNNITASRIMDGKFATGKMGFMTHK